MPGSVIPPPLVRGGQQASSKLGPQASSQVVMPPLVRGAQVSRAHTQNRYSPAAPSNLPPYDSNSSHSSDWGPWSSALPCASLHRPSLSCPHSTPQQIHNIRQHSSTGPPPLLLAPRASVPNVQIQGQRIIQQGLIRVANVPNTSLLVNIPQVRARLSEHGEYAMHCDLPAPSAPDQASDISWGLNLSF